MDNSIHFRERPATDRGHRVACSTRDYDFFYAGLEQGKILIQRCSGCHRLRNPPSPMCPHCRSLEWTARPMSGRGAVFSYTIHHHPPFPGFDLPHPIGLIALDEGIRLVAGLDAIPIKEIEIGLAVRAEFFRRDDIASVRFRRV